MIPAAIALAYMTRGFAAVEAEIARSLLDVDARGTGDLDRRDRAGRARVRRLFGPGFWRAQGYLDRWLLGFPVAVA